MKKRILVVEDDESLACVLRDNLAFAGFDVEWAPETKKLFNVSIKLVAMNQRGVLAKVAAEIAEVYPGFAARVFGSAAAA